MPIRGSDGLDFATHIAGYYVRLERPAPRERRPFTQWATALADDQTLTAGMLHRLLHHAHIVQISGDSYRLKDNRKAGTVRASKAS